ncbi:NADPH-adrenodoxin reductase [Ceratocystis pirilliformis]|uniref:NADPH:adrenodoxin oxidoreductase, mitochondrial n=1 Tax=Ceratocystis pirilliformis TaxID=259994 RepID=A0ABR3Z8P2_9PEZI
MNRCKILMRQPLVRRLEPARLFHRYLSSSAAASRSFRLAIIGAGPAGFYTAQKVIACIPDAKVDMYERLPVPFGLSRFGVAPDHPEVKNCQDRFEEIAAHPGFTYIGNVSIGNPTGFPETSHVPLSAIIRNYDAINFAYGASHDRHLGIPGEEAYSGIHSAREFVAWYNGLPGFERDFGLSEAEDVVIIGQGNVALDVARILLTDADVLRKTDITESALEQLSKSRVQRVHIIGRRGPMQVRLTIKELRELMRIPGVHSHPIDKDLLPKKLKELPRQQRRLMELLHDPKTTSTGMEDKSWSLNFCLSPTNFIGQSGKVIKSVFQKTVLNDPFNPKSSCKNTGEEVHIDSDLVFRSIGYESSPLEGFAEAGIAFDRTKGLIKNDDVGRVYKEGAGNEVLPGFYCSGWVKCGPVGVIASTMSDGYLTAESIVHDWNKEAQFLGGHTSKGAWRGVMEEIESPERLRVVNWDDWHRVDQAERAQGLALGKHREKFTKTSDMLSVVGK